MARQAPCLYLYRQHHPEPQVHELQPDVDTAALTERLTACSPGEFVDVPVLFQNDLAELTLHVQPHAWGAWLIAWSVLESDTPR